MAKKKKSASKDADGRQQPSESQSQQNTAYNNDQDENMEDAEEDEDEGLPGFGGLTALINQVDKTSVDNTDEQEKEKMKLLLSNFNNEQMARYEAFRRANVNRSSVKKLANAVLNQSITANVAVSLSGASKVFVGEIMEKAREVQMRMDPPANVEDLDKARPVKPEHLREAWRLYKLESGTMPQAHWRRQGGDGDGMMFR